MKLLIKEYVIFLCMLIMSSEVFAQTSLSVNPEKQLFKIMIMIMLFILLILSLGFLLKQFMLKMGVKTEQFKILASIPLGTREKILLLKVGQRQLLIGATSQTICTLCEVEEPIMPFVTEKNTIMFEKILSKVKAKGKS